MGHNSTTRTTREPQVFVRVSIFPIGFHVRVTLFWPTTAICSGPTASMGDRTFGGCHLSQRLPRIGRQALDLLKVSHRSHGNIGFPMWQKECTKHFQKGFGRGEVPMHVSFFWVIILFGLALIGHQRRATHMFGEFPFGESFFTVEP